MKYRIGLGPPCPGAIPAAATALYPLKKEHFIAVSPIVHFTAKEHDANTGLIYFGMRYYDPDIGRFITQDSYLGEPGTPPSLNRYLYAYSNPTVYIDLYGNIAFLNDWADWSAKQDQALREDIVDTQDKGIAAAHTISRTFFKLLEGGLRTGSYVGNWATTTVAGYGGLEDAKWAQNHLAELGESHESAIQAGKVLTSKEGWATILSESKAKLGRIADGNLADISDLGSEALGIAVPGAGAVKAARLNPTKYVRRAGSKLNEVRKKATEAVERIAPKLTEEVREKVAPAVRRFIKDEGGGTRAHLTNDVGSVGKGTGEIIQAKKVGGRSGPSKTGEYIDVKGHHVHAKAGFKGDLKYDPDKGFSISQEYMKERGWSHKSMTSKQRKLFDELARSGADNSLKEHSKIAVEALQAGGATEEEARKLVAESLWNLRKQGVRDPSHIPWN